jgi:hypothetical protein
MNQFLGLCGPQEEASGKITARLRPDRYCVRRDPALAEGGIPIYLIVEAMAQHACRASSRALFGGRRAMLAQISDLTLSIIALDEPCHLTATVAGRGELARVECKLLGANGATLAAGTFMTVPLPLSLDEGDRR